MNSNAKLILRPLYTILNIACYTLFIMTLVFSIFGPLIMGLIAILLIGFPAISLLSAYGSIGKLAGMAIFLGIIASTCYVAFWNRRSCLGCSRTISVTKWNSKDKLILCTACKDAATLAPYIAQKSLEPTRHRNETTQNPLTSAKAVSLLTPKQYRIDITPQSNDVSERNFPQPLAGTITTPGNISARTPSKFPPLLEEYVEREFGSLFDRMVGDGTLSREVAGRNLAHVVDHLARAHEEITEYYKNGARKFRIRPHPNACPHCLSLSAITVDAPSALECTPSKGCYHLFTDYGPCSNKTYPAQDN